METQLKHPKAAPRKDGASSGKVQLDSRDAITYFRPMEEQEPDKAPLRAHLIQRIFTYTRPHAHRRDWLFVLTAARGLQLPILAWMIGNTLNGPIAGKNLPGIFLHAGIYLPSWS
jgi:ATP-binding cassette subfamily B protein